MRELHRRAPRRGPRRTLRAATEVRCASALRGATPRRGARSQVRFRLRVVCAEQLELSQIINYSEAIQYFVLHVPTI